MRTEDLELIAIGTATGNILVYSVAKGDLHTQLVDIYCFVRNVELIDKYMIRLL
jgi:hypothetical protein